MFADIVRNGAYNQPFVLMEYGFPQRFSQSHALNDLLESIDSFALRAQCVRDVRAPSRVEPLDLKLN